MTEQASNPNVQEEITEAIEAIKGYSAAQRDQAVARAKTLMDRIDHRLDRLEVKLDKNVTDAKTEARMQLLELRQTLRQGRNAISEWYGGLQHGSTEAWDAMKAGFANAVDDLSAAVDKAEDKL